MQKAARIIALGLFVGLVGVVAPAQAQIPVIDGASIIQLAKQLQEAKQQYSELVNQYNELKWTYNSLSQDVHANKWAQVLENPGLRNPLPNTSLLPNMLDGLSPPSQLGGNLGSLAQQYYDRNKIYAPSGNDFSAGQMQQEANATANFEAIATQNLQSLEAREKALPKIQNQLNTAKTIQQVASIQARLTAEQNYVQAQQAQAANLQLLAYQQAKARKQARREKVRQNADSGMKTLCADLEANGGHSGLCP